MSWKQEMEKDVKNTALQPARGERKQSREQIPEEGREVRDDRQI